MPIPIQTAKYQLLFPSPSIQFLVITEFLECLQGGIPILKLVLFIQAWHYAASRLLWSITTCSCAPRPQECDTNPHEPAYTSTYHTRYQSSRCTPAAHSYRRPKWNLASQATTRSQLPQPSLQPSSHLYPVPHLLACIPVPTPRVDMIYFRLDTVLYYHVLPQRSLLSHSHDIGSIFYFFFLSRFYFPSHTTHPPPKLNSAYQSHRRDVYTQAPSQNNFKKKKKKNLTTHNLWPGPKNRDAGTGRKKSILSLLCGACE